MLESGYFFAMRRGPRLRHETLRGLAVGAACLAFALSLTGTTLAEPPLSKEAFQWFESVEPGGTVRITNPYGSIYARFGGYEGQVEILATAQRLETELPALNVVRTARDGGLEVNVDYLLEPGQTRPTEKATRDRIDLVCFIPQGSTLEAETTDGTIAIKKLKSDVVLSSDTGDLQINAVAGNVQAKTARGRIEATLSTGVTSDPQTFSTVTGDIELWVWEDAKLDIDLATTGEISTDFSIEIEHRRFEEPSKFGKAQLGGGGPALSLYSKKGRLKLLRLQKDFRPD
jgi:hypothetical protein